MSQTIEVKVPDIGDFSLIPVIELCVKVGDTVEADAPLVTLESEKATMDVPAPQAGIVKELRVGLGERVSEGTVIALLETTAAEAPAAEAPAAAPKAPTPPPAPTPPHRPGPVRSTAWPGSPRCSPPCARPWRGSSASAWATSPWTAPPPPSREVRPSA